MAVQGNAETLERLLIEVVGDDSKLRSALEDSIKAAQDAAEKMRAALNLDLGSVTQSAQQAATAFEQVTPAVLDVNKVLDAYVTEAEKAFERTRAAGVKSEEQFEEYRQAALEALESQGALARGLGYTGTALDDLAKRVREAAYAQSEQSKQSERAKQEQAGLEETIKRLTARVSTQRNFWAGRIRSDDEFRQSTEELRAQLLGLVDAGNLTEQEMKRVSQALAYAQRGLDSVNKVASRGGLAWTTQIALANQFQQQLRGLGPAGNIAAGALGLVQGGLGGLNEPLKLADLNFLKLIRTASRFVFTLAPLAGAVGAVIGAGALARLTDQAAKLASQLEAATYRTGLSIEGLQELQYAARQTNVPVDLLNTTMQRLQRRAADANAGNKNLKASFDALGVTLTDANGRMLGTEELLAQVADGLASIPNEADRLRRAFQVFDTEGGRLLPLLMRGSEGIKELRQQARDLGLVVSGDTIMSLVELGGELDTLRQRGEVLRMEFAGAFLPLMRDVLVPVISNTVIPAVHNLALAVDDFITALTDTGPAGTAFRAQLVSSLQTLISFGKGVVAAAQAVTGLVQGILSGVANLGAFLGTAFADVDFQAIEQGFRDSAQAARDMRDAIIVDPARFNLVEWSDEYLQAIQEWGERAAEAEAAAAEAAGGRFGQAWQAAVNNSMGKGLGEAAIRSFEGVWSTLTLDVEQTLEDLFTNVDTTRPERTFRQVGQDLMNALDEGMSQTVTAPAGSIRHAEQMAQHWGNVFATATTDTLREQANQMVQKWTATLAELRAPFEDTDPLEAARAWTTRLTAEVAQGAKPASEVFDLIQQGLENTRAKAQAAFEEFGWDSNKYQAAIAQLNFLEAYLEQFQREHATVKLTLDVGSQVQTLDFPGLFPPEQQVKWYEGLITAYRDGVLKLADTQASLNGVTRGTRDAYAEAVEVFEIALGMTEEGTDAWYALASALVPARARLKELNEELGRLDVGAVVDSVARLGRTITTSLTGALGNAVDAVRDTVGTLADPLAEVRAALTSEGRTAQLLGIDFDATASEVSILERQIRELSGSYENLTLVERFVLNAMSARLAVLKALGREQAAQAAAASAARASAEAYADWAASVRSVGEETGPLAAQERTLISLLEQGVITVQQYAQGRKLLADTAGDLAAAADAEAYQELVDALNKLGVTADPVAEALTSLDAMLAAGKITAEEYAAAVAAAAEASERLTRAQEDTAAEKAANAWQAASTTIDSFLTVNQSNLDNLREAAQDAFKYGVIGAEQLAAALAAIEVMETVENFRILASELDGIQALVPELMADFTRAFAMLSAGNTTDAVAVGFRAAAQAVNALGDAFADTATQGEAMLDLVIGAAAGIATAIGGPAMGQAVGAVGQFIKSILGDLTNGLAEIQRQIDQATTRSTYLGESLIQGIADANTSRVSRGGILGFLGLTKAQLDEDAFRAAVTLAEGIANGLVNTLRAGNFEEAWKSMVDDILIQGIIERFMATTAIQEAIGEAFALLDAGNTSGAASRLEQVKSDFRFIWEQIQEITGAADQLAINVSGALTSGFQNALNSSTWADAWDSATLMMKNTLRDAIVQAFIEGEAMKKFLDRFNQALNHALQDGVISDAELKELERIFAESEGPLQELWGALEALGLGFDDLNDAVQSVTNSMSNVPSVFLDTQAMFDSVAARGGWSTSTLTQPAGAPVMNITFEGPVYGMDDFESRVTEAVNRSGWRGGLAAHGVSR